VGRNNLHRFKARHYADRSSTQVISPEALRARDDIDFFTSNYPYTKNIINYIPTNITVLTEMDFLMSYTVDNNDNMILSYNVNQDELHNEGNLIGRLFYVPVQSKILYTTFEIPDFIIYKHTNHTNFTG
jgi:hypothetical protein